MKKKIFTFVLAAAMTVCTAASSKIGQSGKLLAEMAEIGDWQDGERFSSGASDADVAKWVETLHLN